MRPSSFFLCGLMLVPSALGCGGADESSETPCAESGVVVAQGEAHDACVQFGGLGADASKPPGRHTVEMRFSDDIVVELSIPTAAKSGATLELGAVDGAGADTSRATADLVDYRGFEGGSRPLCATPPGFPANAASAGTLRIDALAVDSVGWLKSIDGALDATFEGCSIEPLGISNATLELSAKL